MLIHSKRRGAAFYKYYFYLLWRCLGNIMLACKPLSYAQLPLRLLLNVFLRRFCYELHCHKDGLKYLRQQCFFATTNFFESSIGIPFFKTLIFPFSVNRFGKWALGGNPSDKYPNKIHQCSATYIKKRQIIF